MAQLVLVAAALQAFSSIQAGQARGRQLHLQGAQASLEGQQRALQYEQQANMTLQKLNETNAAARARGSAGGVQSFQGSAALIQDVSTRRAGKEFEVSLRPVVPSMLSCSGRPVYLSNHATVGITSALLILLVTRSPLKMFPPSFTWVFLL